MGVLITTADFVGRFAIPSNSFSKLDSFITDTEEDYLVDLLGADLYALFKADLTNKVPVTTKYLEIYNAFKKDYCGSIVVSKGMKQMLLGFIFFDFMRQNKFKNTENGQVITVPDTGAAVQSGTLFKILNDSVDTYVAIQKYILYISTSDYSEFNGQFKDITNPVLQ